MSNWKWWLSETKKNYEFYLKQYEETMTNEKSQRGTPNAYVRLQGGGDGWKIWSEGAHVLNGWPLD